MDKSSYFSKYLWDVDNLFAFSSSIATLGLATWIFVNEIISILENAIDIGVNLPPFLMPLVRRIKKEIETASGENDENGI